MSNAANAANIASRNIQIPHGESKALPSTLKSMKENSHAPFNEAGPNAAPNALTRDQYVSIVKKQSGIASPRAAS
jgi:hypothetical protein